MDQWHGCLLFTQFNALFRICNLKVFYIYRHILIRLIIDFLLSKSVHVYVLYCRNQNCSNNAYAAFALWRILNQIQNSSCCHCHRLLPLIVWVPALLKLQPRIRKEVIAVIIAWIVHDKLASVVLDFQKALRGYYKELWLVLWRDTYNFQFSLDHVQLARKKQVATLGWITPHS